MEPSASLKLGLRPREPRVNFDQSSASSSDSLVDIPSFLPLLPQRVIGADHDRKQVILSPVQNALVMVANPGEVHVMYFSRFFHQFLRNECQGVVEASQCP